MQIKTIACEIPGWTSADELFSLYILATNTGLQLDGDILEVGSWCGRSSVILGMASKSLGVSKVHCIDLFPEENDWYENLDSSYSFELKINGKIRGGCTGSTVWRKPYMNDIVPVYKRWSGTLAAFDYHIQKAGLEGIVIPFRGNISDFVEQSDPKVKIRLAFIDGDHSYEAVCEEIHFVEKMLIPGGWICFDDAFSSYEGVTKAIKKKIISSGKYDYYQQMTRKLFIARKI